MRKRKVKLIIGNHHTIWAAKFRCPIDRRITYVGESDMNVYFGASSAFMKEDPSLRKKAIIDWDNKTVTEL